VTGEGEPNDSADPARDIPRLGIVSGRIAVSDAGTIVTDTNVTPNILGSKLLQDWYRFTVTSGGLFRLDLVYQTFTGVQANDVDVFLFREEGNGTLTYVARSIEAEAEPEVIVASLTAGTYVVAVQAWNTPGGAIDYWFVTR
jgi:hypothetical protein